MYTTGEATQRNHYEERRTPNAGGKLPGNGTIRLTCGNRPGRGKGPEAPHGGAAAAGCRRSPGTQVARGVRAGLEAYPTVLAKEAAAAADEGRRVAASLHTRPVRHGFHANADPRLEGGAGARTS